MDATKCFLMMDHGLQVGKEKVGRAIGSEKRGGSMDLWAGRWCRKYWSPSSSWSKLDGKEVGLGA